MKFWSLKHKNLYWTLTLKISVSPICVYRLCLQEESIYLHPSCTPTWQGVGWGQFWWGEAKSWRWYKRTSTSVHTTRWATVNLILPRGTVCRDPPLCIVSWVKSEFYFSSHWAVCFWDEDHPEQRTEKWSLRPANSTVGLVFDFWWSTHVYRLNNNLNIQAWWSIEYSLEMRSSRRT